jgi:hypothetical protein
MSRSGGSVARVDPSERLRIWQLVPVRRNGVGRSNSGRFWRRQRSVVRERIVQWRGLFSLLAARATPERDQHVHVPAAVIVRPGVIGRQVLGQRMITSREGIHLMFMDPRQGSPPSNQAEQQAGQPSRQRPAARGSGSARSASHGRILICRQGGVNPFEHRSTRLSADPCAA